MRPTLKSTGPKPAKRLAQALDKPSKAGQKKRQKPDSDMENSDIDSDPIDSANGSILSLTPPSAKKQKKAAPPKRAAGKPLEPMCNESYIVQNVSGSKAAKNVSASEQYQRV